MKQYLVNLIMAFDQFFSTVLGGHPDDTISQRLGRAQLAKPTFIIAIAIGIVDFIAWFFFGEIDHCLNSLKGKSSAKEIWNWGGSRDMVKVDDN